MKAEFLKIAGVKSEAEFYKKFPSEEAFMKKHGKAINKLKAKKSKVGTMIPNIQTPSKNNDIIRFGEEEMYNASAKLMGDKTYKELKDDAMYNAKLKSYQASTKPQQSNSSLDLLKLGQSFLSAGDAGGASGASGGGGDVTWLSDASEHTMTMPTNKNGGSTKKFTPHMMYNSKTGKGKKAKTLKEHLALKKKGWGHTAPKAQFGDSAFSGFVPDDAGTGFEQGTQGGFGGVSGGSGGFGGIEDSLQGGGSGGNFDFGKALGVAAPIVSDFMEISDQIKLQKKQLGNAKQRRQLSDLALKASKTMPEKVERDYVRPEDFTNTGEEFFPVYGVGTNILSKNGGAYKAQNGGIFNGEYMPLTDPNQQKQFNQGGTLGSNSYLVPKAQGGFDMANVSYGGGAYGAAGQKAASMVGVNDDAGSAIGGTIGSTIGSAFGPAGAAIGGFLGSAAGDLLDRNDRRQRIENEATARNEKEMAFNSIAPSIQAGYASHVKNGGKVSSYKNGGSKMSSNPSMLDTMTMGGELKSLWGGELETVSYNPHAGGESVEPKNANSHNYRDPKTGETGQGIAFGENAVNNNKPSVEIETGEPMQKLIDGGGDENLVVYGDMYIPDNLVSLLEDDKAKGKKFKNYVSNILNPQESKINKRQEKVADLGLESDDTAIGQLERNTADIVLKGSDMKLKSIADKKNILAELQNVMNETFDQYGIDANKFIKKGELVEDPMRIENSEMAKYGKRVPKAQSGITTDDFNVTPKVEKTPEQLLKEGYTQDPNNPLKFTKGTEEVISTPSSGESLGYTPEGQSANESGTYGNTTQKDVDAVLENNTWFKGGIDLNKEPVIYNGQFVNPDVLRFQQEFNERVEGTDIKTVKVDGRFGEETKTAKFTPAAESKKESVDEVMVSESPETTAETTTIKPKQTLPIPNFQRPIDDIPLGADQLLGEYYALATNQVQPVQAQTMQPRLRVPYDISLQDMRNDLTSQSRMLERNQALQNNPAALAMMQAPMYDAINKINAEEFRQNQAMKDSVYSGNLDVLNQARLTNLGIYDKQADRQAQAVASTRSQNIDALQSIGNKRAQNLRDNAIMKTYANMYPTFRFDDNYRTQVQQTGQSPFSIPNQGNAVNPFGLVSNVTGNNNVSDFANLGRSLLGMFNNKNKQEEEEVTTEQGSGRYGKKVTKNNRNSNILRDIRNL